MKIFQLFLFLCPIQGQCDWSPSDVGLYLTEHRCIEEGNNAVGTDMLTGAGPQRIASFNCVQRSATDAKR